MLLSRQMRTGLFSIVIPLFLLASVASASDLAGIWAGQLLGRQGEKTDVAFEFKQKDQTLTGKMFGDEFDLAIEEASVSGSLVKFTVTTTNYYNNTKTKFVYSGTISGTEMELTRERTLRPDEKAPERERVKQTFKLMKLSS